MAAAAGVALLALTACNDDSSAVRDEAGSAGKGDNKDPGGHSPSPSPSGTGSPEATSAPSSPGAGSTASAAPTGSTPVGPRSSSNDKRVKVLKCADSTSATTVFIDNSEGSDVDLPLTIKIRIVDASGGVIETDKAFVSVPPGETRTKSVKMNFTNRASEVALCEVNASVY
ncbi:hypothetical protein [Streptomyces sp. NPDC017993]|uniref:hypothetical protein n=1 Tax=Streptomyces sp. NPDC017993 TaxID=3365027 RepID=UPI0037B72816